MITEYELYCDERYHTKSGKHHLLLGGIVCTENGRQRLQDALTRVRGQFSLTHEMRWAKVSNAYLNAYKAWTKVFFEDRYARFSLLSVNLSGDEWNRFRPRQNERPTRDDKLASLFYQFLLVTFGPLRDTKRWWVYPDAGFFSKDRVLDRIEFLFNRTYKRAFGSKTSRIIRFAHAKDSKSVDLIQLSDVLLGAASCAELGTTPTSPGRRSLVEYCRNEREATPNTQKGLGKLLCRLWVSPGQFRYS